MQSLLWSFYLLFMLNHKFFWTLLADCYSCIHCYYYFTMHNLLSTIQCGTFFFSSFFSSSFLSNLAYISFWVITCISGKLFWRTCRPHYTILTVWEPTINIIVTVNVPTINATNTQLIDATLNSSCGLYRAKIIKRHLRTLAELIDKLAKNFLCFSCYI